METKSKDTCLACSCPCAMHTVHTHGGAHEHEHDHSRDAAKKGVCLACGGDKNAKHTCG